MAPYPRTFMTSMILLTCVASLPERDAEGTVKRVFHKSTVR